MSLLLTKLLLVYACGFMDRIRGDRVDLPYSKSVEAYIYGLAIFTIVGLEWWQCLIGGALWLAGASFGWGEPVGAVLQQRAMNLTRLEKWQVGVLATDPLFALMARGLIWGLCLTPMMFFKFSIIGLVFGMVGVFTLAVYLADCKTIKFSNNWESMEYYRGWMAGLVAFLVSFI